MPNLGLPSAPGAPVLNAARAEASRRNGAKSRGPKTPEGKARSAQNALKHGLRAQKHMLLPGESAAEYQRLEAALLEELAPEGALQAVLARRVVAAAWRLERVERIEVQLFAWNQLDGVGRNLGLALIRDCNNARAFDTLLRYRGGTLAEFWRALRTLKALQAERHAQEMREATHTQRPDEPKRRRNPDDSGRPGSQLDEPAANPALARLPSWPFPTPAAPVPTGPAPTGLAPCAQPIEPEMRGKPPAPRSLRAELGQKSERASLLAGTALVPLGRPSGS
jgi:hypothetical protein